jgi:hypothetical protein
MAKGAGVLCLVHFLSVGTAGSPLVAFASSGEVLVNADRQGSLLFLLEDLSLEDT